MVTFGSSDSDTFAYDSNSDRMTGYTFAVNSQSAAGTLTWNSIGTLGSLAITDAFNSSNAQTCTYTHDDLSRIASDNCGSSTWSQTFSYDPFGNITKVGNPGSSFQPTYSIATNHMTLIGSNTPTYDANGNVTSDFLNSYAWDSNARPVTVNGVGVTYDALGRMVEQNNNGTYYQIVYSPLGAKLAIMKGTTLQRAYVPLTGGAVAVYNSGGLAYYRHSDWLGSSRLTSTTTRTVIYDGAYGPFGEQYANSGTTDLMFTGMEQDTSSNVYDFPAREYGIQGRWPSPDPGGLASVDPTDPQMWNRYAYVRNNPLSNIDPTGLRCRDARATSCNATLSNFLCDAPFGAGDVDNSCNLTPGIGGYSEFDLIQGLCLAECAYLDQVMYGVYPQQGVDPCIYLTNNATQVEWTDYNSDPAECKAHGGTWVNPGQGFIISDGSVIPGQSFEECYQSAVQANTTAAAKRVPTIAKVSLVTGLMVCGGLAIAEPELAEAALSPGCIGSQSIGTFVPLMGLDFSLLVLQDAYAAVVKCNPGF